MNILQPRTIAPEFNISTVPSTLIRVDPTMALSQKMVPAPQILYDNRKFQHIWPGFVITGSPFKSKTPLAAIAKTKQPFLCNEWYIQGHIVPECILFLRKYKQVITNYGKNVSF